MHIQSAKMDVRCKGRPQARPTIQIWRLGAGFLNADPVESGCKPDEEARKDRKSALGRWSSTGQAQGEEGSVSWLERPTSYLSWARGRFTEGLLQGVT